jgi:predicted Zn finger-like uncharacterized protein
MKFLCPQCKAKYRIADEKLAQRATSKMKCRKCGHIIDIKSAAVPESIRAGAGADDDDDDADEDATGSARPVPRVAPKPGGASGLRAATPPPRRAAATPPKRTVGSPPRRSGVVAVARAVAEKEPAEVEADDPEAPPQPARSAFDDEDAPTRIHDGGALSAAFSFAVGQSAAAATTSPTVPDEWYVGIDGSPIGPLTFQQLKEKAAARKATLDSLVWKDGFEEWKPLRDFPELVALVEDAAPPHASYEPEARTVPAPSPLEALGREKVPSALSPDVLEELGVKKRKQAVSHPVAWIAVFVAMAFGVTIGIVLFSKTEKQEKIIYVPTPGQASAKPVAQEAPVGDNAQTLEDTTVSGGGPKRIGGGPARPEPSSAQKPGGGLLKDFGGPNLGPAPGSGNDQGGPGNAPGGQLDSTSITRTVGNYTPGVRRGCWETALSARAADAPTSARVSATITIAPSGNVENVTTSGDPKGYPSLARCIESKVRTWRFPRSSGTTTANVPFVFAAQ